MAGRYDFAVKVSPYTGPGGRTSSESEVGHFVEWCALARGAPRAHLLHELPLRRLGECEVPRAAVTNGFRQLVGDWHELRRLALSVYVAWDLAPFLGPEGPRVQSETELAELERAFYAYLLDTSERYARLSARLHWEADFWGQYLAHLSDCEDAAACPFPRFPGQIKNGVSMRFRFRLRMWRDGRTVDDYVFRAAQGLYEREETAEMTDVRECLRKWRFKILEGKGYPEGGVKVGLLDPGRYRPRQLDCECAPGTGLTALKQQGKFTTISPSTYPLSYTRCFNTPESFDVDESYNHPRTAAQAQFARERRDPEPPNVWTRMSTVSGQNQRRSRASVPPSAYSDASSSGLLR